MAISTATAGASIRYTLDGSAPSASHGIAYSESVAVSSTTTPNAIGSMDGWNPSPVSTAVFTITGALEQVAVPTFSPIDGTYDADQNVEIHCATADAVIRYTTNGSTPTESSDEFTTAIDIMGPSASLTIMTRAFRDGMTQSTVATGTFTVLYQYSLAVSAASGSGYVFSG